MSQKIAIIVALVIITIISGFIYAYESGYLFPNYLIIFHAGSLSVPLTRVGKEFTSLYPKVRIAFESSGSIDSIRKIIDLHKSCDVLAVADYMLIPKMMYLNYANWTIIFASNEMVIAYTKNSRYNNEITLSNWYKILNRTDVILGRSDPFRDPAGYRALLVFQLASIYYKDQSINNSLWNHEKTIIRPKSIELLAGLESGAIDYAFIYKSEAVQHGLSFIELPDEINLSKWEFHDYYAQVNITLQNNNEKIIVKGAPILYGLTIPKNAKNPSLALEFVKFMLSENGRKIMKESGQDVLFPAYCDNILNVPDKLKEFVKEL